MRNLSTLLERVSSYIQHIQLALQILGILGGGIFFAVVFGVWAFIEQQPAYWIASLVISIFAGLTLGATSILTYAKVSSLNLGQLSSGDPVEPTRPNWYMPYEDYLGVKWRDVGDSIQQSGVRHAYAAGPYCPQDNATLQFVPAHRVNPSSTEVLD